MTTTSLEQADTAATTKVKASHGKVSEPASINVVRFIVVAIVLLWMVPAIGLLVTSFRTPNAIESSGWWTVLGSLFDAGQWTTQNYTDVLQSNGFDTAFVNTLIVSVPATIIPITIAAFAAYAFSWMEFKGRYTMFVFVVALLVVPLHVALIPLLQLYSGIGPYTFSFVGGWEVTLEIPLSLNNTFLGVWLAHTGFGLPLAIYLLRNYIGSLPSSLIESARIDGADHYAIFTRLIVPLSVPALASFAIFQFLWVFNDFLVALVFLGPTEENRVLTIALNALNGSFGQSWHLLTAGAFLSMVLPMAVFFSLQRFFVRGITAGAVKG